VHIGTGNYNPSTARVYTDYGLLTADRQLTTDIADIFNRMTGFARPTRYRGLLVAPNHMRKHLIKRIKREGKRAAAGDEAHILFKCNAITDPETIEALYDASQAGVRVDLLVRGVCCLVPGVRGQSENIRVRSVVGRFLEHSRAYWFKNGDKPELLIGSADLMQRNLDRRVEVLAPLLDPVLQQAVRDQLLEPYLVDTERTRELGPDGLYRRHRAETDTTMDVQQHFIDAKRW
jgi:polyphosphate kinase